MRRHRALLLALLLSPTIVAAQSLPLPPTINLAALGLGPLTVVSIDTDVTGTVSKAVLYGIDTGAFYIVNPHKPPLTSITGNTITRAAVLNTAFCTEAESPVITSPEIQPQVQPFTKNGREAWLVIDMNVNDGHQPFREIDLSFRLCR